MESVIYCTIVSGRPFHFALELLRNGADVHLRDPFGTTFLHLMADSLSGDKLAVARIIIEKGADVNHQKQPGLTPLYLACQKGNFEYACMLLYYGADASISSDDGVLPFVVVSDLLPEEEHYQLQTIVFDYTFDEDKITLGLPALIAAMTNSKSRFFCQMIDHITHIDYDERDLKYLDRHLNHVKPSLLKLFLDRFDHIVGDIINKAPLIEILTKDIPSRLKQRMAIIDILLNTKYAADLFRTADTSLPIILRLVRLGKDETMIERIYIMLSYGLGVTSADLDMIYNHGGYCEMFRILLHMDVTMVKTVYKSYTAALFYNPKETIDDNLERFLYEHFNYRHNIRPLLYYNHPKLKEKVLSRLDPANVYDKMDFESVMNLPRVPCLIELSRNAARKYIVDKFNIRNSAQFYTVLKKLPIGEMNRKIIALEEKMYEEHDDDYYYGGSMIKNIWR